MSSQALVAFYVDVCPGLQCQVLSPLPSRASCHATWPLPTAMGRRCLIGTLEWTGVASGALQHLSGSLQLALGHTCSMKAPRTSTGMHQSQRVRECEQVHGIVSRIGWSQPDVHQQWMDHRSDGTTLQNVRVCVHNLYSSPPGRQDHRHLHLQFLFNSVRISWCDNRSAYHQEVSYAT